MNSEDLTGELAFAESVSSSATATGAAAAMHAYAAANGFSWSVYFPFYSPDGLRGVEVALSDGGPTNFFEVFLHYEYSAFGPLKWTKSPVVHPFLLSLLPAIADITEVQAGAVARLRHLVGRDAALAPTFGPAGRNGVALFAFGDRPLNLSRLGMAKLAWVAQATHAQILSVTFERRFQIPDLTAREYDVYRAIVRGMSNLEIAEALSLSPNTIDTHIRRLFAKLGVNDRIAAIRQAVVNGLFYQLGGDSKDRLGKAPARE